MRSFRNGLFYSLLLSLTTLSTVPAARAQGNETCVPAPSGIVSWWPADGNPNDIVDGNPGALIGSVTYVPGHVGQAFDFGAVDGAHVRVENAANLNFNTKDSYTIEFWMKSEAIPPVGHLTLVGKWQFQAKDSYPYAVRLNTGDIRFPHAVGTVFCGVFDGTMPFPFIDSTVRVDNGQFHHIACVYNHVSQTVTIYIDGSPDGTTSSVGLVNPLSNRTHVSFGIRGNGNPISEFNGVLDEVTLYDRALSHVDIADIFLAGSAGKCKGLQLIPPLFDQVQDLIDASVLTPGQGGDLINKLERVREKLDRGNTRPAINQVGAFINQVNNFFDAGVLTIEQRDTLVDLANGVIDLINSL